MTDLFDRNLGVHFHPVLALLLLLLLLRRSRRIVFRSSSIRPFQKSSSLFPGGGNSSSSSPTGGSVGFGGGPLFCCFFFGSRCRYCFFFLLHFVEDGFRDPGLVLLSGVHVHVPYPVDDAVESQIPRMVLQGPTPTEQHVVIAGTVDFRFGRIHRRRFFDRRCRRCIRCW